MLKPGSCLRKTFSKELWKRSNTGEVKGELEEERYSQLGKKPLVGG